MKRVFIFLLFLLFFMAFLRTFAQGNSTNLEILASGNKTTYTQALYTKQLKNTPSSPVTCLKLLNEEGEIVFFARVENEENIGNLLAMAGEALSGQYTMQITKGKLLVSEKIIIGEGVKP